MRLQYGASETLMDRRHDVKILKVKQRREAFGGVSLRHVEGKMRLLKSGYDADGLADVAAVREKWASMRKAWIAGMTTPISTAEAIAFGACVHALAEEILESDVPTAMMKMTTKEFDDMVGRFVDAVVKAPEARMDESAAQDGVPPGIPAHDPTAGLPPSGSAHDEVDVGLDD